jgi:hypothetical protein
LTGIRDADVMERREPIAETLADEVARYLAVVDAFRAHDSEPTWRPELVPSDGVRNKQQTGRTTGPRRSGTQRKA